ncbi:Bacteriophage abortive infection AbiH [Propionispira arboris]|uniref:Bacteriophage abortive infection AbiH n=1 Tax=Propionispira arboris TaxID=84035 RepID=A0A1H7CSV2_9FIRM|nr:AbiH family protein [Propionispira arboris]SEJ89810.1 Bacteriophage abortive infection AbiH [Propionispira arboris]
MKILVIGNGFDLAHKLPTAYTDFLEFMSVMRREDSASERSNEIPDEQTMKRIYDRLPAIYKNKTEQVDGYDYHRMEEVCCCFSKKIKFYMAKMLSDYLKKVPSVAYGFNDIEKHICFSQDEYIEYSIKLSKGSSLNNKWFEYFEKKLNDKRLRGINWVDFEAEIKDVIQSLEHKLIKSKDGGTPLNLRDFKNIDSLMNLNEKILIDLDCKGNFINPLDEDLNLLIDCLEIYMQLIDKMCIGLLSPDLRFDKFDKVVSFNYTDCYHDFYQRELKKNDIDFIHGKAGDHNLVLGIDETLKNENDISNELSCIKFKKYFQRIYKYTGIKYIDWLENADENSEIVIFGHSLDCTDGEILEKLITCARISKTTIYYYNDEAHAKQILNLVKILKKDELIKRTGKKNIVFRRQAQMLI